MENTTVETEPTASVETEPEVLKTQYWGDVPIDTDTYYTLLELYKETGGITAIVKIAAHIGKADAVDWFASSSQESTPGDTKLARILFYGLCNLVTQAEKWDAKVDRELEKEGM